MYQAKSVENQVLWGGWCLKVKVAQNGLKHILALEFLKSGDILNIFVTVYGRMDRQTTNQLDRHHSDQLGRSTLETARLNTRLLLTTWSAVLFV